MFFFYVTNSSIFDFIKIATNKFGYKMKYHITLPIYIYRSKTYKLRLLLDLFVLLVPVVFPFDFEKKTIENKGDEKNGYINKNSSCVELFSIAIFLITVAIKKIAIEDSSTQKKQL